MQLTLPDAGRCKRLSEVVLHSCAKDDADRLSSVKCVPAAFLHPEGIITIDMIAAETRKYGNCSPAQLQKLYDAYELLVSSHRDFIDPETGKNLTRDDGSDYLQHAMRVAYRIAIIGRGRPGDLQQTIAAMLHDVPEDFGVPLEIIRAQFGGRVADMVFWLTKPKWNGESWVYADNSAYYQLKDKYIHSMYERRGYSYYRRLYYDSGDPSAWVIKAADNLDNLHTLKEVPPEKRQRNVLMIVNNTLAVLSRMLAKEDTDRLVDYIRTELGFEAPPDAIAGFADRSVVACPPREILLRRGLQGVTAPDRQINVYGADPKYVLLLGWIEIGLPDDGTDYLGLLRAMFRDYSVMEQNSYLPPGLAASEKIFRISGFRRDDQLHPYTFTYDPAERKIQVSKDGKPFIIAGLGAAEELSFEEPHLKALRSHINEKCELFLMELEDFHKKHVAVNEGGAG